MVLTREEKERLVLDLYNHRTPIRDIARGAGMSALSNIIIQCNTLKT